MKRLDRRGQFFLLAAVIIIAIVVSFGIVVNKARVNKEPENFYDFIYEVERETGNVIDYSIYNGFEDDANLSYFVSLLARDVRDKDPDSNFVFVYGDNSKLVLENYGPNSIDISGSACAGDNNCNAVLRGGGSKIVSKISFGGGATSVAEPLDNFDSNEWGMVYENLNAGSSITLTIGEHEFPIPISEQRQVIFLIRKDVKDESFVAVS